MKYKTLFRLALKLVGVVVFLIGAGQLLGSAWSLLAAYLQMSRFPSDMAMIFVGYAIPGCVGIAVGLYLFFGGKWIVDKAIPSNRPYCHECGYDLTAATGHLCNECGTPFKPESAQPELSKPELSKSPS